MKLLRLALAIFFLASTTLSVAATAHAACGGASDQASHSHDHDPAASHDHGDDAGTDDSGALDDSGRAAGANCHGSAGCPGCVSANAPALPSPAAVPIAFRPSAESGQSAEPDTQLRPPKIA